MFDNRTQAHCRMLLNLPNMRLHNYICILGPLGDFRKNFEEKQKCCMNYQQLRTTSKLRIRYNADFETGFSSKISVVLQLKNPAVGLMPNQNNASANVIV